MKQSDFEAIKKWFVAYVRSFDTSDELVTTNLGYKEVHSYEVAILSRLIAESLNLSSEQVLLAALIGLLHDTGRFPQFFKYRTFKDTLSENHACLGVRVLKEKGILSNLSSTEQEIILSAIQHHNIFILSEQPDPKDLFCRIIRDADKLDIYRFILESEENRLHGNAKKTILLELDEQATFNETMLISILNNQCCLYSDLKSIHDFKLLQLSWIFDINYPFSFKLLQERDYLSSLCALLPEEQNTQTLKDHVNLFLAKKVTPQKSQRTSEE